ncbi:hypothetical protein ACFSQT_28170 [Mesorhizobium calcicola]|uniref:Uncharacterized protein n=1 Tax=Mesorhizobium calcicola TaxID=1300310 RepID=A0ABW4WLH1_9HYPH
MNVLTNRRPTACTAKELVEAAIHHNRLGSTVSVKETVMAIRQADPHLEETDCELVEIIVGLAVVHGQFVVFDLKEP